MSLSPEEKVIAARLMLLKKNPFFGYILAHIPVIPKDHLSTKKVYIVYNPEFFEKLSTEEVATVLVHECMHYVLGHSVRGKILKRTYPKHAPVINLAEDIVINAILSENGFRKAEEGIWPTVHGTVYLVDSDGNTIRIENAHEKSVEEVFHELLNHKFDKIATENTDTASLVVQEDEPFEGEKQQTEINRAMRGSGDLKNPEILEQEIKTEKPIKNPEDLLSSAYTYAKSMGTEPLGIERRVRLFMRPIINWRAVLKEFLAEQIPYNYTFLEPDEDSPPNILLPGIEQGEHVEGIIAVDTSASISDEELSTFLSEVHGIASNFASIDLTVVFCDCEIQGIVKLKNPKDVKRMVPVGLGGTDFRPVFEYAEKKKSRFVVYLTDGYGEFPQKAKTKTLWIVTPDGLPEDGFPFGRVVRLKPSSTWGRI